MRERWLPLLFMCLVGQAAADPVQHERVQGLAGELRCVVCQNQTLADSSAPLALELKKQIEGQVAQGVSDAQVIDYLVQRYGDFILYRPPLKPVTWPLWFGPFAKLLGGLPFYIWKLRQRAAVEDNVLAQLAQLRIVADHGEEPA